MKSHAMAALFMACFTFLASQRASAMDWLEVARRASVRQGDTPAAADQARILVEASIRAAPAHGNGGNGSNGGNGHVATSDLDRAAEAVAAYVALEHLYPGQQPEFERLLAIVLSDFPETDAKAEALAGARQRASALVPQAMR